MVFPRRVTEGSRCVALPGVAYSSTQPFLHDTRRLEGTLPQDRKSTRLNSSHSQISYSLFFFFNDPATTEISPLSLHDALPICVALPGVAYSSTQPFLHDTRRLEGTLPHPRGAPPAQNPPPRQSASSFPPL